MKRGFPKDEFARRLARAQARMNEEGLGALLLTTEPDIRYFTGFLTRFWESPSRPWFLVVPAQGEVIAVIPSIGEALMSRCGVQDIRTWPAPRPEDDGISILADTLAEVGGPVGVPSGHETYLRMPLAGFDRLRVETGMVFQGDAGIVAGLRAIKSEAEIEKIAQICGIAGRAFSRVPEIAKVGAPVSRVFRDFQRLLLEEGADWVPYLAGGAGQGGYADVISPASDAPLHDGDVLMLDTGAVWDGYFCDYDRNYAVGRVTPETQTAYARLIDATAAGYEAALPGARACDVWRAMANIVGAGDTAGRLGHGLGLQLTEGLSLMAEDQTVLAPGMVITLEPGVETVPGQMMVHEENIVIRDGPAQRLSGFASAEMSVI